MKSFLLVAALAAVTLSGCGGDRDAQREPREHVRPQASSMPGVRAAPVSPYPEATRVRLLIASADGPPIPDAEGRLLTAAERTRFEATLRHETVALDPNAAPSADGPACFIPHHFFRYLDASGAEIGRISVCFCCGGVSAYPLLPFQTRTTPKEEHRLKIDQAAAETFVAGLGLPTDVGCRPVTPPPSGR